MLYSDIVPLIYVNNTICMVLCPSSRFKLILLWLFCAYLYMNGQITVSEIVFTVSIYFSTMGTIGAIVNQIPTITERLGSATKAYSELVVPVDVVDAPNAPALQVSCGEIEFRNVSFKYKRKWVFAEFQFENQVW